MTILVFCGKFCDKAMISDWEPPKVKPPLPPTTPAGVVVNVPVTAVEATVFEASTALLTPRLDPAWPNSCCC